MAETESDINASRIGLETEQSKEALKGEILYQDNNVRISHPVQQGIPMAEGLQLVVDTGQELDRQESSNIPELLRASYYALAVAKVMAEGRFTEESWANVQMNSHPGTKQGVNVFGKSPHSVEAWAKPVNIREEGMRVDEPLEDEQKQKLARTMELYLPRWEKEAEGITVFSEGIGEIKPEDSRFQQEYQKWISRPDPWHEKFSLVVVEHPHLNGLHLVCHARENYWSQKTEVGRVKAWETNRPGEEPAFMQGFVESSAILLGIEQLIKNDGRFFNSEIHYSGNWGFKPLDPANPEVGGRQVDYQYLAAEDQTSGRKTEKRDVRERWTGGAPDWHAHGHLYATRSPEEYVSLPSRPAKEVPGEWEQTKPLSEEEERRISEAVQANLTVWLENNCQGVKIGKT